METSNLLVYTKLQRQQRAIWDTVFQGCFYSFSKQLCKIYYEIFKHSK